MFRAGARPGTSLTPENLTGGIMRLTKILLVCLGLVLSAGLRGNHVSGKANAAKPLLQRAILADGGEPLPRPPLVADGGEPLPRPPLVAGGGGAPTPSPAVDSRWRRPSPAAATDGGWRRTAAEATAGD